MLDQVRLREALERETERRKKVIVVMPAYNAAETLAATIDEMPMAFVDDLLLVDDASADSTVEVASQMDGLRVIAHERNQGYGANQKTCYTEALASGADIVVMIHPDNQYNPAILPNLVLPLYLEQADVVLASRFILDPLVGGPVAGGMPRYKFHLNRLLTWLQNWMMGTYFSEFHTGYRAFTREALEALDFTLLSDDFAFDNQILAAFVHTRQKIHQVGVETRYFAEASSIRLIPGMRYSWACMRTGLLYLLHRLGVRRWRWLERVCRVRGSD